MTATGERPTEAGVGQKWQAYVLHALPGSIIRTAIAVSIAIALKGFDTEISQFFGWMLRNHQIQISLLAFGAVIVLYLFKMEKSCLRNSRNYTRIGSVSCIFI
jgi:hypothetical protein